MNIIEWLIEIFTHHSQPDVPGINCVSTIFGLNYDGSIDKTDNGQGAFNDPATGRPYDTRDKSLVGVSIPIPFYEQTANMSREDIESGKVTASISWSGGFLSGVKIVDLGPGEGGCLIKDSQGNPHLLDRTYGLCQKMGSTDNEVITYWLLKDGVPYVIQGQDSPYKVI